MQTSNALDRVNFEIVESGACEQDAADDPPQRAVYARRYLHTLEAHCVVWSLKVVIRPFALYERTWMLLRDLGQGSELLRVTGSTPGLLWNLPDLQEAGTYSAFSRRSSVYRLLVRFSLSVTFNPSPARLCREVPLFRTDLAHFVGALDLFRGLTRENHMQPLILNSGTHAPGVTLNRVLYTRTRRTGPEWMRSSRDDVSGSLSDMIPRILVSVEGQLSSFSPSPNPRSGTHDKAP